MKSRQVYVVYLVRNLINGKRYIGKTSGPNAALAIKRRWREHVRLARKGANYVLSKAIRKYGMENFAIGPLHIMSNEPGSFAMEVMEIARISPEYNLTKGGEGVVGYVRTPEQLVTLGRSLSVAMRGKPKSAEHARNISVGKKGKPYRKTKFSVAQLARQEAISVGSIFYTTGTPCSKGHLARRYTSTRQCCECHRLRFLASQTAKHQADRSHDHV